MAQQPQDLRSQRVVRHRRLNRLCVSPRHLALGTQADKKRDDWENRT